MLARVLSEFPWVWPACLAMLIFLGIFVGVIFWIFRRDSRGLYETISAIPLKEHEGK
ncbi:MAG: hypothetical protein RJB38_473 [Pseudomonadota bacterium]|jgi:cbb3-type cytochrome oxidase subunit 3